MNQVFGLPVHPLLAHLTVVAIPVAAVLAGVVAVFPRVPQLVKATTLGLAALAVVLVPLMETSGEALEEQVAETAAVERHAEMGESLLPWVIGLLVVVVAVLAADWWRRRAASNDAARQAAGRRVVAGPMVTVALAVAAVAVAAGTLAQTVAIGHSGAQAVWSSPGESAPTPGEAGEVGPADNDDD